MANEVRLIDANLLRQTIESKLYWGAGLLEAIDDAPTIDPETLRPKGQWIVIDDDYTWNPDIEDEEYVVLECECPICGERTKKDRPNYCDNCGAKMEG